ncbi:MAG: hypothetical protein JSV86_18560 [Gemmatimonadota bacterium]|nr:MAG: hypothetical protein JSV86_18560 [Gemmatimonadota bacterium]
MRSFVERHLTHASLALNDEGRTQLAQVPPPPPPQGDGWRFVTMTACVIPGVEYQVAPDTRVRFDDMIADAKEAHARSVPPRLVFSSLWEREVAR